jgi:hypothetical protein
MVVCGLRSLALTRLSDAAQHISYRVESTSDARHDPCASVAFQRVTGLTSILDIDALPREMQQQRTSLLSLTNHFANAEAGDPRDKVYALLGLATDHVDVVPDDAKSVIDVYTSTAQKMMMSSGNLNVLRACEKEGFMGELPSCVPNWTAKSMKIVGGMESFREPYSLCADGALADSVAPRAVATFSANGKRMCAQGVIMCTIDGEPTVHFVDGQLDLSWAKAYALPLKISWTFRGITSSLIKLLVRRPGSPRLLTYLAERDVYKIGYVFRYFAMSFIAANRQRHAKWTLPKSEHSSNIEAALRSTVGEDRRKRTIKSWHTCQQASRPT